MALNICIYVANNEKNDELAELCNFCAAKIQGDEISARRIFRALKFLRGELAAAKFSSAKLPRTVYDMLLTKIIIKDIIYQYMADKYATAFTPYIFSKLMY